jgi:RimK family alpha-L-glutamate ligase
MAPPEVAILGGRAEGWHGLRLRRALEQEGCIVRRVGFDGCRFALGEVDAGLRLGDLPRLPDAVVVRSIPAGSFEQVTLRLGLLHALEALGTPVVNAARSIERCVDKSAASFLLARAGLPTPRTWVVERAEAAAAVAQAETAAGRNLVLKPLFGAQGKGLRLIRGPEDLPPPEEVAGVYYLQRFVGGPVGEGGTWRDFRVFVVAGRAVAAMTRHGPHWITNIGQGATPERAATAGRLAELAVAAASALAARHAGVDLIEDAEGRLQVLEVNSMPAWRGLQSVSHVDIAGHIAADVARRLPAHR